MPIEWEGQLLWGYIVWGYIAWRGLLVNWISSGLVNWSKNCELVRNVKNK